MNDEERVQLEAFGGKTLKQNLRDVVARNNTGYSYQELVDVLNSGDADDLLDDDELENVDKTVKLLSHLYIHTAKSRDQQIALATQKEELEALEFIRRVMSDLPNRDRATSEHIEQRLVSLKQAQEDM